MWAQLIYCICEVFGIFWLSEFTKLAKVEILIGICGDILILWYIHRNGMIGQESMFRIHMF